MNTTFNTKSGKAIKVSAIPGSKPANWNPSGNNYRVTVSVGSKSASFDYWDSYANRGKAPDLRGALSCFAGDALAGMDSESSADIMAEFGYTDPKEANRVFKAVKHAQEQAERLGLSDDDLAELCDY